MYTIEQAYRTIGLTENDGKDELEKRYRLLVRRMRAGEIRGSVTSMEEARMMAVNRAYRFILDEEMRKNSEAYRFKRYGKYKGFSELAERIDHFIFYYKPHLIGALLLVFIVVFGVVSYRSLLNDKAAFAASSTSSELSILVAGDISTVNTNKLQTDMEQRLLKWFPQWRSVQTRIVGSNDSDVLTLYTEIPDLYIVNQSEFIRLLRMGYLSKLDEWDTYGIDLVDGPFANLVPTGSKPLICAVSINSEHRENAIRFIHRVMPKLKTQLTIPTEAGSWSSSLFARLPLGDSLAPILRI